MTRDDSAAPTQAPPLPGPPPAPHPGYGPAWPGRMPPALSPGGQPLASFGDRLLAQLLDWLLLAGAALVVSVPLVVAFTLLVWPDLLATADRPDVAPGAVITRLVLVALLFEAVFLVALLGLYYLYAVEMMFRTGQTWGKKVMNIRIVPLDPAATLTRGAAARRYAVEYLGGFLVPFLRYLDGFWQLWDKPYQQCLHDKAAGTVVVKAPA